jgi:hypothetical protein
MADVITGNTQLSATKNDLIISLVQRELKFKAKLLRTVSDFSSYVGKGMKSVKIPKLDSFTVVNRASGAQGDSSVLTSAVDTIDLNFNAYIAWIIDSYDEIQSSIDVQMENALRAAGAQARYIDTQLIAALESVAYLDVGAAPITQSLILDAREALLNKEADPSKLTMLVGTDQEKAMLAISDFVRADAYGNSNIPSGQIGSVYGMPVIVHTGVAAGKAYWYEAGGVGIAFQKNPSMSSQLANQYGTGAQRVAMDQLFGVAGLRLAELGALAGKSPLVVKM